MANFIDGLRVIVIERFVKKGLTILLTSLIISGTANAQISLEDPSYKTEFIWGIKKSTTSGLIGGLIFKKSIAISDRFFKTFGLELVNVKHPKEQRFNSNRTGNFFIWGKENYLYAIRAQYGRDLILFQKAPQQGVQITAMLAGGPSIGLLAPYTIEHRIDDFNFERVQFDPDLHRFNDILGTGHLFQGITDSKIQIGANLKTGLSFEFGTFKSNVTGFEVGFLVDAYANEIVLMPLVENRAVFPTAFITLFYGSRK